MTGEHNQDHSAHDVLARYDAYISKVARGLARGRRDFQEDLLQEARAALWLEFGVPKPPASIGSPAETAAVVSDARPDPRHVALNAMRRARRRQLSYERRSPSLDAMLEAEERRVREEECEAA